MNASVEAMPQSTVPTSGRKLYGWPLYSVLIALMLTLLLAALDQTIVNTALPRILRELNGFDRYIWVVTIYLLTSTTVIPIYGKLSDQYGRKWLLIGGVSVFLLGSILSGAAQDMNQLIAFRGLQGLGAGAILSLIFTIVSDIFPPIERPRWQGVFAGVFGLASVFGPSLGGWITDNASWRWVFYVNVPIGILALAALTVWLPNSLSIRTNTYTGADAIRRIDFAGAITIAAATTFLLLGLTWGSNSTFNWNSPQVIGVLMASAVLIAAFIFIERSAIDPILPLDLFKSQIFLVGSMMALVVGMAFLSAIFYLPLFIQDVQGQSASSSGTVITPLTLTLVFSAAISGQIVSRIGRYQVLTIVGSLILGFGIFLMSRLTPSSSTAELLRDMLFVGVGLGVFLPILNLAVQNDAPRNRLGVVTSAVTFLRSLGGTLGIAILGAVVNTTFSNALPGYTRGIDTSKLPPQVVSLATNQRILGNASLQHTVIDGAIQGAIHNAVQQQLPGAIAQAAAAANAPTGTPQYATIVKQVTASVTQNVTQSLTPQLNTSVPALFHSLFNATRLALGDGIVKGFTVSLLFCAIILLLSFFLKDKPLSTGMQDAPSEGSTSSVALAE